MEDFNNYLTYFKSLDIKEKKKIVLEQLKMLAVATNGMCKDINANNEIIINKELSDVTNKDFSDDDYMEALIVLINSIQGSICDFNDKMSYMIDTITN